MNSLLSLLQSGIQPINRSEFMPNRGGAFDTWQNSLSNGYTGQAMPGYLKSTTSGGTIPNTPDHIRNQMKDQRNLNTRFMQGNDNPLFNLLSLLQGNNFNINPLSNAIRKERQWQK